jgi:predicted transcriptional regulator
MISIKPRYIAQIIRGTKTVELRRTLPRLAVGDGVLVYESSPTRAIVVTAVVAGVVSGSPGELWDDIGRDTGLSRAEYDHYFAGAKQAVAIHLEQVSPIAKPISLATLRKRWSWLQPPQSFRYVRLSVSPRGIRVFRPTGAR